MSDERYLGKQNLKSVRSIQIGDSLTTQAFLDLFPGQSVALSGAGTARLRYNGTSNKIEASLNGGIYQLLGGGESRLSQQLTVVLSYLLKVVSLNAIGGISYRWQRDARSIMPLYGRKSQFIPMKHLDLFSGIGGFALAVEAVWPEAEHIFCDNDLFCQAILKKHWPTSKIYGDIHELTANTKRAGQPQSKGREQEKRKRSCHVDLITGGFPCQPFSQAGRRKGTGDDRHLWPEMRRVISEFSPTYVVAENVRGLLNIEGGMVFEQVCVDLETIGYEVQPFIIPACAVNAPHRRDRVWIVAHAKCDGQFTGPQSTGIDETIQKEQAGKENDVDIARTDLLRGDVANTTNVGQRGRRSQECGESERKLVAGQQGRDASWGQDERRDWSDWYETATRLCTLDDGLSGGLARPRGWRNAALKGAGNAIVPQVAEQIFLAIKELI